MKRIVASKTIPYAQSAPHLPPIQLTSGEEIDLPDSVADSAIRNGHGRLVGSDSRDSKVVEPDSKDNPAELDDEENAGEEGAGDLDDEESDSQEAETLEDLREQAESLDITVDKRWGEDRLKTEIENASGANE